MEEVVCGICETAGDEENSIGEFVSPIIIEAITPGSAAPCYICNSCSSILAEVLARTVSDMRSWRDFYARMWSRFSQTVVVVEGEQEDV